MYLGKMTMTVHGKGIQNGPHVRVNLNVKNVSVPGGHSLPLYNLYGDVPLDRVWFFYLSVLNRVYNFV